MGYVTTYPVMLFPVSARVWSLLAGEIDANSVKPLLASFVIRSAETNSSAYLFKLFVHRFLYDQKDFYANALLSSFLFFCRHISPAQANNCRYKRFFSTQRAPGNWVAII